MPMKIEDARPSAYQGDLSLEILTALIKNSVYEPLLPFGGYNQTSSLVKITNGAHEGSFYGELGNYYFDIEVNNGGRKLHCLIKKNSTKNNQVLGVR